LKSKVFIIFVYFLDVFSTQGVGMEGKMGVGPLVPVLATNRLMAKTRF
jgi:hypothetical protein